MVLFLSILFSSTSYANNWWEQTISEDEEHFYYVGMSSKRSSKKEAIEDAYAEALKEAIRHNYGVVSNIMGQYKSTEEGINMQENTLIYRSGVKMIGISPLELYLEEDDDKYIAYRRIKYPRSEIAKEKIRLENIREVQYTLQPVALPNNKKTIATKDEKKVESKEKKLKEIYNFSWIYNPISLNSDLNEFITMPLQFEFFPYNYLSFNVNYTFDLDEFEDKENSDIKYVVETKHMAIGAKLYLYRSDRFSFGIGSEYIAETEDRYYESDIYGEEKISSTKIEATSLNASIRFQLRPRTQDKTGVSFYSDYRQYDEKKYITMGLSFNY
jgi:hypothetical protein